MQSVDQRGITCILMSTVTRDGWSQISLPLCSSVSDIPQDCHCPTVQGQDDGEFWPHPPFAATVLQWSVPAAGIAQLECGGPGLGVLVLHKATK